MQIFLRFLCVFTEFYSVIVRNAMNHADSVCNPLGVISPLLNVFWRTPSPKYAPERVHTDLRCAWHSDNHKAQSTETHKIAKYLHMVWRARKDLRREPTPRYVMTVGNGSPSGKGRAEIQQNRKYTNLVKSS